MWGRERRGEGGGEGSATSPSATTSALNVVFSLFFFSAQGVGWHGYETSRIHLNMSYGGWRDGEIRTSIFFKSDMEGGRSSCTSMVHLVSVMVVVMVWGVGKASSLSPPARGKGGREEQTWG